MNINSQLDFSDLEVVKNKNLMRSHYNFSALDQKIVSMAFAKFEKNKKKCIKEGVHISSNDLVEYLEIDKNNIYNQMHESAQHLVSSFIDIYDDESESFIVINLFKTSAYNNGIMLLQFSDNAIHYMETGVKFQYLLGNFKMLQSRYSTREYEILRSYLDDETVPYDIKKRKYFELDLEEFRHMTGTTFTNDKGKKERKYKNTGDFKIKVLDVADREINNYTDINTRYILIKKGRSYQSVGFWISSKADDPQEIFEKEIHSVENLTPPNNDIVEIKKKNNSNDFKTIESLMEEMKGIKLLQVKNLLELTDPDTIRFIYSYLTKDGDYTDIYNKILSELQ